MNRMLIVISLLILFTSCTNSVDNGGASETIAKIKVENNKVTGTLTNCSNPENFSIKVFDEDYLPTSAQFFPNDSQYLTSVTFKYGDTISVKEDGSFSLSFPEIGNYNIFITDQNSSIAFMGINSELSLIELSDTIVPNGDVEITLKSKSMESVYNYYVALNGTDFWSITDQLGNAVISNVPTGKYSYTTSSLIDVAGLFSKDDAGLVKTGIDTLSIGSGTIENVEIQIK